MPGEPDGLKGGGGLAALGLAADDQTLERALQACGVSFAILLVLEKALICSLGELWGSSSS